jgi:hypothetical protein
VRIKLEGYRCMPAPHALYSKMLAERTASRNVLVLFYLFYFINKGFISACALRCTPECVCIPQPA